MGVTARFRAVLALVCALVIGVLAGCTSSERNSASTAGAPADSAAGRASERSGNPSQDAGKQRSPASVRDERIKGQRRELARTASLTLAARDVGSAAARARQIATDAGGYTAKARTGDGSATLELSVPSEQLDPVLASLTRLGEVQSRQQTTRDVTGEVVDIEARLESQRASVQRVRTLLDQATSINDIVSIESELASRQAELESLQARYDRLTGQVAMSTVSLRIHAAGTPAPQDDTGILGGLAAGWDAFLGFGAATLTALAATLPFLLFFGVPLTAVAWYVRRRRKTGATEH